MKKKLLLSLLMVVMAIFIVACNADDKKNDTDNEDKVDNNEEVFDPTGGHETNTQKYADVFAEADIVADKARLAMMTYDYGAMSEIASPTLLEKIETGESTLLMMSSDNKEALFPSALEVVGEFYDFGRLDELYNEQDEVVWYYVDTISTFSVEGLPVPRETDDIKLKEGNRLEDEPEKILEIMYPRAYSRYFGVKKDPSGEWKVGTFYTTLDNVEFDGFDDDNLEEYIEFRNYVVENMNYIHQKPSEEEVKERYMEKQDSFGF